MAGGMIGGGALGGGGDDAGEGDGVDPTPVANATVGATDWS